LLIAGVLQASVAVAVPKSPEKPPAVLAIRVTSPGTSSSGAVSSRTTVTVTASVALSVPSETVSV